MDDDDVTGPLSEDNIARYLESGHEMDDIMKLDLRAAEVRSSVQHTHRRHPPPHHTVITKHA